MLPKQLYFRLKGLCCIDTGTWGEPSNAKQLKNKIGRFFKRTTLLIIEIRKKCHFLSKMC